jgi:hypothetical protein
VHWYHDVKRQKRGAVVESCYPIRLNKPCLLEILRETVPLNTADGLTQEDTVIDAWVWELILPDCIFFFLFFPTLFFLDEVQNFVDTGRVNVG